MFIPDQISTDELQQYLDDMQQPAVVDEIVDRHLDQMIQEMPDPIVHKVAAVRILESLIRWHDNIAKEYIQRGDLEQAMTWAEDAGRLSIAAATLQSIAIGDEDKTVNI